MKEPVLSILMPVYNHQDYIEQALKSIEDQHIFFSYEVIIGEDCSTDGSKDILEKVSKSFSTNYYVIYREKNEGMKKNISDLFYRARGKYITVLEGDDYWTYSNKINSQISFLEKNAYYSGYAHRVTVVGDKGQNLNINYPAEKGAGEYTLKDYLCGLLPGQTSSFLYRNYFVNKPFHYLENNSVYPLDRFISFVVASNGKIYCTNDQWSAYRYITHKGSSFSASINPQSEIYSKSALQYHKSLYKFSLLECKDHMCIKISEKLYYKSFLRDWRQNDCKFVQLFYELCKAKFPISTLSWIILQLFSYRKRDKDRIV